MTKTIESYYIGQFKEAYWLVGIAIAGFALGLFAIGYWGNVGAGILVIFGGFAIYQIIMGFWVLFLDQNLTQKKLKQFNKKPELFVQNEIKNLEKEAQQAQKYKTYKMISFLFGLLFLFMGAFGNWSEISLGIGAGLSLQSAIMLIIGLFADYRGAYSGNA